MPFIPHTQDDVQAMCDAIGVDNIDQLFDEIPASLALADISNIPDGMNEAAVSRLLQDREPTSKPGRCFIGAGAYEHYIPAAVWQIAQRGEYYTAYTPYQAEASQGNLQLIYEYQTMMASLMGLDVSNASLYDGATALAEAVLMAVRLRRGKAKRVLLASTINPRYRQVLKTLLTVQEIELIDVPYCTEAGVVISGSLASYQKEDNIAAVIIPQPNFFGRIEDVDELTNAAHQMGALAIAVVNPLAMALFKPPGKWGENGADIACGEGQPLGIPLSFGGPYFGFMCCKQACVRQLPGRLVGRTKDADGKTGFVLTLQAREQHIRRAKATSNICTNQGLMVTAATIYMSLMGPAGLRRVAETCHANARKLWEELMTIDGVKRLFPGPFFHEFIIQFNKPVDDILQSMRDRGIQAGFSLQQHFPEFGNALLINVTETKTPEDLEAFCSSLREVL